MQGNQFLYIQVYEIINLIRMLIEINLYKFIIIGIFYEKIKFKNFFLTSHKT